MNTTHFIQSAEVKDKYEGRYANIESFNRKFEARLTQRNPLAMAIVNGQIAVKEIKSPLSPLKSIFKQATSIMTQVMLAVLVVMSVSPEERTKWTETKQHRGDNDYKNLIDILATDPELKSKSNIPIDELIQELHEQQADKDKKDIPNEKILEYIQSINAHEHETDNDERLMKGQFTTKDYLDYGIIKLKQNTDEEQQFHATGIMPKRLITKAMADIDQTIQETVSAKTLRDKRHLRADGRQRNGLEIYRALQTPHDNPIMNALYLHAKIQQLTKEEARIPAAYFSKLLLLRAKLDRELERLNVNLEKYEILTMLDTLVRFAKTTEGQAAKQALLQRKFEEFKHTDEFRNILLQVCIRNRTTNNTRNTMNNQTRTTKTGKPVACHACGKNHYLNECTNEKAIAKYKSENPEQYKKSIQKPLCKFGEECRKHKVGTCKFRHETKANQTDGTNQKKTLRFAINSLTTCQSNHTTPQRPTEKTPWILDNGSAKHFKTTASGLRNVRQQEWQVTTQNGTHTTTQVGDVSTDIKDVIINEKGSVNLLSPQEYLKTHDNEAFVTVNNRVFSVPLKEIQNARYNYQVAKLNEDNVYEIHQDFIDRHRLPTHNHEKQTIKQTKCNHVLPKNIAMMWHRRLGHLSPETMLKMKRVGWLDIPEKSIRELKNIPCKGCQERTRNKNHTNHIRKTTEERNATRPTQIGHVHADIAKLPSGAEFKAMTLFVDAKSRYTHAVFDEKLKPTSQRATENIKHIQIRYSMNDNSVKSLRFDKESGYIAENTKAYLNQQKINLEINRSSEQNLAESKIAKIRDKAQSMIHDRNIPAKLKPYAFRYAVQVANLTPTDGLGGRTPYQEFYNKTPYAKISKLRTFGSIAYYKRPEAHKTDRAEPCIFLGLSGETEGHYLIYSTKTKRILTVNDAEFVEIDLPPNWFENLENDLPLMFREYEGESTTNPNIHETTNDENDEYASDHNELPDITSEDEDLSSDDETDEYANEDETANEESKTGERPNRTGERPNRRTETEENEPQMEQPESKTGEQLNIPTTKNEWTRDANNRLVRSNATRLLHCHNTKSTKSHRTMIRPMYPKKREINIPKNRRQMLQHKYAEEWKIAEEIENDNINEHGTLEFIPKPNTPVHTLRSRYVYDVKTDEDGNIIKFKARLVVLGYEQKENEYKETYAPVTQWATIMILLLLGWTQGMNIRVMDFKGAYLHAERPEETPIYLASAGTIKIPEGKIAKVRKSLYGTVDAGNLWKQEVHKLLTEMDFNQSKNDPCLYIRRRKEDTTYIATWVDDLIIATTLKNPEELRKEAERKGFKISLFEPINKYLGVSWTITKDEFKFDQEEYIEQLLTNSNMARCKGIATPMTKDKPSHKETPEGKLRQLDSALEDGNITKEKAKEERKTIIGEREYLQQKQSHGYGYRSIIGGLSHLARRARPDIQFATFYLSRYQNDPGTSHFSAAKRILRYLQQTKNKETRGDKDKPVLQIFVDADHAGDPDKQKSTTGYTVLMHGVPIITKSRIQRMTAKSSTNAELIALTDATEEAIWLKNILLDFNISVTPTILCDSQPAIDTIKNNKLVKGNKHIARRYHFVKGYVTSGDIKIEYVPTEENLADIYTKPLDQNKHKYFIEQFLTDKA